MCLLDGFSHYRGNPPYWEGLGIQAALLRVAIMRLGGQQLCKNRLPVLKAGRAAGCTSLMCILPRVWSGATPESRYERCGEIRRAFRKSQRPQHWFDAELAGHSVKSELAVDLIEVDRGAPHEDKGVEPSNAAES